MRNIHIFLVPLLLLTATVGGCGGSPPAAPPPTAIVSAPAPTQATATTPLPPLDPTNPSVLGPEDVLEAWITAQEEGDFGWAMTFLSAAHQDHWLKMSDEMSTDDLISSGLQFRQDDYQLSFSDDHLTVFWSDDAKLYLVLTREVGGWKVDPDKTDEMNQERAK
jgi:hypothetical protein